MALTVVIDGVTYNLKKVNETTYKASMADTDLIPFASPTGKFYHQSFSDLKANFGGVVVGFKGDITPAGSPSGDGVYFPSESGTYTNFGGIVVDLSQGLSMIVVTGGASTQIVIPIDLSGYVADTELTITTGKNIFNHDYVQSDKAVASNGAISNTSGAKALIDLPIDDSNSHITVSGFIFSSTNYVAFVDGGGIVLSTTTASGSSYPRTFTIPPGAVTVRFTVKTVAAPDDSGWLMMQIEYGETATEYEPYAQAVSKIKGDVIEAEKLSSGNFTPDPIDEFNAANKRYVDENAITDADLTITPSTNLADPSIIVNGQYISNTGSIATGAGWSMAVLPVSEYEDGQEITFGRFTITGGGYAAFRDAVNNTLIQYLGLHGANPVNKTVIKPEGATHLYIDIKRPADPVTNYEFLTINLGSELLPYESPSGKITAIDGYEIGGGSSNVSSFEDLSDVPTYTGNAGKGLKIKTTEDGLEATVLLEEGGDVQFGTVTASGWVLDLPTGAGTEPPGLSIGDAWVDTVNSTIKVKLS